MRFGFAQEQLLLRETVRDLLAKECPPASVREVWSGERGGSAERWSHLARVGVLGLAVPVDHGGLGLDELTLVLVLEECGRAAVPEPVAETAGVVASFLSDFALPGVGERWLPGIASGETVATVGHDLSPHVAAAQKANLFILQSGEEVHALERSQVRVEPEDSLDKGRALGAVHWSPTPDTCVVKGERGRQAVDALVDAGAFSTSAVLLGVAQQLVDMSAAYARERRQFGQPIGAFQAVKHMLADALLKLEFARPVVYRAAYSVARGLGTRSVDVSMAKAYASDAATLAARVALQVHGAIGYTWEHDLHLWMKKAWALAPAWGDPDWHRARVASALLGEPQG